MCLTQPSTENTWAPTSKDVFDTMNTPSRCRWLIAWPEYFGLTLIRFNMMLSRSPLPFDARS